jgi:hypothetical protein
MNSSLNPDAVLAARADERLAHAYQQIVRADDQLARVTEKLSKMEHDAAPPAAEVGGLRPSRERPAMRGLAGLVLAGCIGAAAYAAQSPSGEAARLAIAQWAPAFTPALSPRLAKPGDGASPAQPAVQMAVAEATAPQPALAAQSPAQDMTPPPAAMPAELTQMLQAMARDIAAVEQGIEQLKANQERMAADNARAIEQLKASQAQVAHLVAKPLAPDARAKPPVPPPPQTAATAARKPAPTQPSQARAQSQPVQLQPDRQ